MSGGVDAEPPDAEPLDVGLARRIVAARGGRQSGPLVVGLCGPQGSGKSTLTAALRDRLGEAGLATAALSLDDLYLTRAERRRLATEVHPLLAVRGPPGTHDVALGLAVLQALAGPGRVELPRFDKGRDDRRPREDWDVFDGPADVVLLEGWCVGARPQATADLAEPVNALERDEDPHGVWRAWGNDALAGVYQALFARIGLLVLLQPPGFEVVAGWREEQEAGLRARLARDDGPGRAMTPPEVARFVQHYERLTRHIAAEMPARADVVVALDAARRPTMAKG